MRDKYRITEMTRPAWRSRCRIEVPATVVDVHGPGDVPHRTNPDELRSRLTN